jgi:hypothetical protein
VKRPWGLHHACWSEASHDLAAAMGDLAAAMGDLAAAMGDLAAVKALRWMSWEVVLARCSGDGRGG